MLGFEIDILGYFVDFISTLIVISFSEKSELSEFIFRLRNRKRNFYV